MRRTIKLIDCNYFYVACQLVFRPDLEGKPVVVLSNCDGMPISRNNEAKALGIEMAEPWFKIREVATRAGVIAFSSNYTLYADMSNRVMTILSTFSPSQEIYSIDESFLDMTGIPGDMTAIGREIKAKILKDTGLPTCVGTADTKLLAKAANHYAKKHPECGGVCNFNAMSPRELDELLAGIHVGQTWGIGKKLSAQLSNWGIFSMLDLKRSNPAQMRQRFSVVMDTVIRELNGDSCIEMEYIVPAKKQIVSSRSFGYKVSEYKEIEQSISHHVREATRKLREQKGYTSLLTVFFSTSPHGDDLKDNAIKTVGLPSPTCDTRQLNKIAVRLAKQIYKAGYRYMRAGVMLGAITTEGQQTDLFGFQPNNEKSEKLMDALDDINARMGKGTVRLGSEGFKRDWEMKRELLSPEYTTNWDDILVAH